MDFQSFWQLSRKNTNTCAMRCNLYPFVSDQQTPTMEEGSEKIGKDDMLMKLRKECRKWPQLS